ncbi:acetyltransferase, GNAT family [Lachnoanaerobaculum saburreum DSM 3986]|uniref:Acetyltransferase, GNAT family n=1 Tax=Lachnoanaerobaculum saburreum DSM 3986 TaxID=887325 RepID=E6LMP0_9FIRM|nr:GNAT family N-acetyltransferase [Lachnoanaerobaculum saburreum]EFU76849.1 acetyltransferase, GNAT family [Lachnoanaerobaculum saburreum DSM 3986]
MKLKLKLENIESKRTEEPANLIRAYNRSNREPSKSEPLNIYLEDEQGNLKAGMVAETFGNWLEIEYLYVSDDLRGQGIGSKILKVAERESKERGCKYSFVDTFNFQALKFYEKHGYKEVFALKKYPYTGERYYYTKEL